MGQAVKAALILAVAGLLGVAAFIYYSPYQTCLRDAKPRYVDYPSPEAAAHYFCRRR